MIIGSIGALTQPLIKRVLAYSSVGQLGFILLGITTSSIDSAIFYLVQYTITNTGIWLCLLVSSLFTSPLKAISSLKKQNIDSYDLSNEVHTIKELQGLHSNNVFLSLAFAMLLLSTAGVPPMVGFFAKLDVLSASLNAGFLFLSIIAIITSLISATYYLIIIRAI
jgi:NADH-ubiquinone oxidoreductase chain 2